VRLLQTDLNQKEQSMCYQLTLTADERKAIDWIGYRYGHGNALYKLLWIECEANPIGPSLDLYDGWCDICPIMFTIPEHVAWQIRQIGEECEFRWDCFSQELAAKLSYFCDSIV